VDLRAPLDHAIDSVQDSKALDQMRIALLGKAADAEDARHCVSSTLCELYAAQGTALAGEVRDPRCNGGSPTVGLSRPQVQQASLLNQEQWRTPRPAFWQLWLAPAGPSYSS
jgi:hypothetical protein